MRSALYFPRLKIAREPLAAALGGVVGGWWQSRGAADDGGATGETVPSILGVGSDPHLPRGGGRGWSAFTVDTVAHTDTYTQVRACVGGCTRGFYTGWLDSMSA